MTVAGAVERGQRMAEDRGSVSSGIEEEPQSDGSISRRWKLSTKVILAPRIPMRSENKSTLQWLAQPAPQDRKWAKSWSQKPCSR
ncbi:MAG: hypothetical protein JWQ87_4339 [Candidatus Sulfotelmatobacter sp.]|nr:hypothetical protein [Candidatus Sulfotelmatobacter sp.]